MNMLDPTRRVSTDDPHKQDVKVRIGLHIEQDESVPVPAVAIACESDEIMHIIATNYEGSDAGARAVAETLYLAADAIYAELVRNGGQGRNAAQVSEPKRPRFNPRPVVGKQHDGRGPG